MLATLNAGAEFTLRGAYENNLLTGSAFIAIGLLASNLRSVRAGADQKIQSH